MWHFSQKGGVFRFVMEAIISRAKTSEGENFSHSRGVCMHTCTQVPWLLLAF